MGYFTGIHSHTADPDNDWGHEVEEDEECDEEDKWEWPKEWK